MEIITLIHYIHMFTVCDDDKNEVLDVAVCVCAPGYRRNNGEQGDCVKSKYNTVPSYY